MRFVTKDRNKEAGGKGFPNQSLYPDYYRSATLSSVSGLTAHDHTNLSTTKAVCSLPLGAQPHQPASHWAPSAFLLRRRQATFPDMTVSCQTSLQALQRIPLTIQDSIPRRVNNFIQTYHLLSQISYFLTLKMPVSPLSDQFLCLYTLLHMVRNSELCMELSVLAKLGADCAPAGVCTAACWREDSLADSGGTPWLPEQGEMKKRCDSSIMVVFLSYWKLSQSSQKAGTSHSTQKCVLKAGGKEEEVLKEANLSRAAPLHCQRLQTNSYCLYSLFLIHIMVNHMSR